MEQLLQNLEDSDVKKPTQFHKVLSLSDIIDKTLSSPDQKKSENDVEIVFNEQSDAKLQFTQKKRESFSCNSLKDSVDISAYAYHEQIIEQQQNIKDKINLQKSDLLKLKKKKKYNFKNCNQVLNSISFYKHNKYNIHDGHRKFYCELCNLQVPALKRHYYTLNHKLNLKFNCYREKVSADGEFTKVNRKLTSENTDYVNCLNDELITDLSTQFEVISLKVKSESDFDTMSESEIQIEEVEKEGGILIGGDDNSKALIGQNYGTLPVIGLNTNPVEVTAASSENVTSNLDQFTTEKNIYNCDVCKKKYSSIETFKIHILKHFGFKTFLCSVCTKNCNSLIELKNHIKEHHASLNQKFIMFQNKYENFESSACDKKINNIDKHSFKHVQNSYKRYTCQYCSKVFTYKREFYLHTTKYEKEIELYCNICNQKFHRKKQLNHHLINHVNNRPYKCVSCNEIFVTINKLNVHLSTHYENRKFKCLNCKLSFINLCYLISHNYKTHTNDKYNYCDTSKEDSINVINGEHFVNKEISNNITKNKDGEISDLIDTENVNSVVIDNNESVPVEGLAACSPNATSASSDEGVVGIPLKVLAVSTPSVTSSNDSAVDQYHVCDVCKKSFKYLGCLYIHKKIHLQERQFLCPICGRGYSYKSRMTRHINNMHWLAKKSPHPATPTDIPLKDQHESLVTSHQLPSATPTGIPFTSGLISYDQYQSRSSVGPIRPVSYYPYFYGTPYPYYAAPHSRPYNPYEHPVVSPYLQRATTFQSSMTPPLSPVLPFSRASSYTVHWGADLCKNRPTPPDSDELSDISVGSPPSKRAVTPERQGSEDGMWRPW